MKTKPPKRRKTVRKEKSIQIRVTDEQKVTLTEAAEKAGIGVSSWMLTVSLEAAARKLADGGGKT